MSGPPKKYGAVQQEASEASTITVAPEDASETSRLLPKSKIPATTIDPDANAFLAEEYGASHSWSERIKELRVSAGYAAPILIAQVLEYSMSIASVVAVGHIGTLQLAASSLAQMTALVTGWSMVFGMVSALDTLLAQAWGSEDPTQKRLVGLWTQRMAVLITAMITPIIILWQVIYPLLISLGQDPEIAAWAALYLRWLSLSLPGIAYTLVARKYYMSIGLIHLPTTIACVIAPLNVALNFILVWGPGPFSRFRLGFIGAPIASGISRNLMAVTYLVHGWLYAPPEPWSPLTRENIPRILDPKALGLLFRLGCAGIAQTASEWYAWEVMTLAASWLGPVPLASQAVLLTTASTCFQLPAAISAAAAVRVGNLVGMGAGNHARLAASVSLVLVCFTAAFAGTILLVFRNSWGYLFNNDIEVVRLVARVLPIAAVFQIFDGLSVVTGSLLRVAGLQFIGALLNLVGYYAIGIPFGLVMTFYFKNLNLGLVGLWLGYLVALLLTAALGLWFSLRTNWAEEVGKAKARLNVHRSESTETDAGQ